jgi:hypothetical protein
VCQALIERVRELACPSCDVSVRDMNVPEVAKRAKSLGIQSLPAVVIDGTLADCCTSRGPDEQVLLAAGLGRPLP